MITKAQFLLGLFYCLEAYQRVNYRGIFNKRGDIA